MRSRRRWVDWRAPRVRVRAGVAEWLVAALLAASCAGPRTPHALRPLRPASPPSKLQTAIAVDRDGNQVLVGSFAGEFVIAGARLQSAGGTDVFIAKFKPDGTPAWPPQSFGGEGDDAATGVAIDQDGSIVVSGTFQGEIRLGPRMSRPPLRSREQRALFVSKFAPGGHFLWVRQVGVANAPTLVSVAIRPDHDIIVGAAMFGTIGREGAIKGAGQSLVLDIVGPNGDAAGPLPFTLKASILPVSCSHSPCEQGHPLNAVCDWCVGTICGEDGYCCTNGWDQQCTEEVWTICGQRCSCDAKCTVGARINAYTCPCVGAICGVDDYCSLTAWDSICVGEVQSVCGQTCP